ncbi:MAG: hypothetical protein ACLUSP_10080 [Christensenellales bacterium]
MLYRTGTLLSRLVDRKRDGFAYRSLVVAPYAFTYRGTEHSFRISIGYAECPADARDESNSAQSGRRLQGENPRKTQRFAYTHDLKTEHRSKLGFALSDVSENLPGAF